MSEYQLTESIITAMNAQEPWPENVKLFQPYEVEQILLPDNASCLAVQAFLKMCSLPFEVEMRWNAEFMSPSGRVPFIKCGEFVVSELEPIVHFAANKGVSLCAKLSTEEKAEMRAYMSLISTVLVNAELYISWVDNETYNTVTKVRNSSVYPWPLGWLQTRAKRSNVAKRLKALNWLDKPLERVLADVEQCCNSLSQRLGDKEYFFGTPTPLDALLYGHIRALISANGPKAVLMIRSITTSLLRHQLRVTKATGMKLKYQEDSLISNALQFSYIRRHIPDEKTSDRTSDWSCKSKRSRLPIRGQGYPLNEYAKADMFGFKPFACKQITIMTTKEGISCEYDGGTEYFAMEIIEDMLDKVDELSFDNPPQLVEIDDNKHDFEVISYCRNDVEIKFEARNELDTIEEGELTDTLVSDGMEDIIRVINDDDSDGIHGRLIDNDHNGFDKWRQNDDGSSNNENLLDDQLSCASASDNDKTDNAYLKNVLSSVSVDSRPSRLSSGLNIPEDREMSVESLLNCLRRRNQIYNTQFEITEID